jgi:hypothetical protein
VEMISMFLLTPELLDGSSPPLDENTMRLVLDLASQALAQSLGSLTIPFGDGSMLRAKLLEVGDDRQAMTLTLTLDVSQSESMK